MKIFTIAAVNPETVCDPQALLACALLSIQVPQSRALPFDIIEEETAAAEPITRWRWHFLDCTTDGQYHTGDLIKWWSDDQWLAAHPHHEWTILRAGLLNMAAVASAIRRTVPTIVVRRGDLAAHIPANATPEHRQWLLDKLEGRLPVATHCPFALPASL